MNKGSKPVTESKFGDEVIFAIIKLHSKSVTPLSANVANTEFVMEARPMVAAGVGVLFADREAAANVLTAHFYHPLSVDSKRLSWNLAFSII